MDAAREGRAARSQLVGAVFVVGSLLLGGDARPVHGQEDIFSLDGLIVTASPTTLEEDAVASHVTVLDSDRLTRFGSRSLAEALRDVSGIDVVRGGSFGAVTSLFLRGGESDYTLVLVDGVPVNDAGGGFDLAELTTDNVERVEIVRGPSSALFGSDAVTGVIHVITKTGRGAPRASFSYEGGSFGRSDWSADVEGGTERAGYSASVVRRASDGILAFNNSSSNTILSGTAKLRPDDRTGLGVALRLSGREYHYPTDGSGAVVDENSFTFSDVATARASVERALSSRVTLEASVGLHQVDGGTDDASDGPADTLGFYGFKSLDHFRRTVGEVRTHVRFDPAVITAGFEYEEQRQRSFTESLSEFGASAGRSESGRDNRAYFVHASGRAGRLSYQAGGRLEDNERFGRGVTWQLGVTARLPGTPSTSLRASAGTAIKEPTFHENFATGFARGNPDLDPERSRSWEIGVEQSLASGAVTLGATYFDQSFEDLIQYTFAPPNPEDPNYFNVAAATSRGVEIDAGVRRGRWTGGASWTWLDTEVTDSGFDEGEGAGFVEGGPLLRRPSHRGAVRAGVRLATVDLSARVTHVGARRDRDFSTFPATRVVLSDHRLVSVAGRWRVLEAGEGRPGLSVELRAENLLDERYQEILGFEAPGRGLYVGGRLETGR